MCFLWKFFSFVNLSFSGVKLYNDGGAVKRLVSRWPPSFIGGISKFNIQVSFLLLYGAALP